MTTLQIGMTASARRGGGLDRYFFGLLGALEAEGHENRGLVVGEPADVAAHGVTGVETYARDGDPLLARWSALRGAVIRRLPESDVVVSHFAPCAFPVLDHIRARPLVVHFHGSWAIESRTAGAHALACAAKLAIERLVYRGGARFVVLTRAVADTLERRFGVRADRIRVVPGGVDLRHFNSDESPRAARTALGLPLDRPIVVTTRRLIRGKGIEQLLDATRLISKRVRDVLVVVAGDGPLAEEYARRVREQGLEKVVRFTGFLAGDALRHVYRAADLSVVPTTATEGFGLVVIEALACGTPAMVTPVDGLPETVRELDPALVFAAATPEALADGIVAALRGGVALPSADACRAYAARFAWKRVASRVRDVYAEVA